jgi:hypothetical protein
MKTILVTTLLLSFNAIFGNVIAGNVMAEMYKCQDYEGYVTYTELPCAEESLSFVKKIEPLENKKTVSKAVTQPVIAKDPKVDYLDKVTSLAECAGMYFSHDDAISELDKRLRLHATKKLRNSHQQFGISEDRFVLIFSESFKKGMQIELTDTALKQNQAYCSMLSKTELNRHFLEENTPYQLVDN